MGEARWRDFDREKKKQWDQLFLEVLLEKGKVSEEVIHEALRRQQDLLEKGFSLSIAQVLLKMRALQKEDFLAIQRLLEQSIFLCRHCQRLVRGRVCPHCGGGKERKKKVLGNYEILSLIAQGGMGRVYKARHLLLGRVVALKVLHGDLAKNPKITRRFRREWELAARLKHKNIVQVFDAGVVEGRHFYTMEYVEGKSLQELFQEEKVKVEELLEIIRKVALALDYAHQQGVLHRDIKPANILVDSQGEPRVTDFGIARALEEPSDLTKTGMAIGTLFYMAPEQARGEKDIDCRCDVYSLGATLYEGLTGHRPFEGDSYGEVYVQVLEKEPKNPRTWNKDIPPALEAIVLKAMAKSRDKRYKSCRDFAKDIERYLQGEFPRVWQRKKIFSYALVVLLLFVLCFLYGVWKRQKKEKQPSHLSARGEEERVTQTSRETSSALKSFSEGSTSLSSQKKKVEEWKKEVEKYFLFGRSFLASGDPSQALFYLEKAVSLSEKLLESSPVPREVLYFAKALALYLSQRRLEAKAWLEKSLQLNPDYRESYFVLSFLFRLLGEEKKALQVYQKAVQKGWLSSSTSSQRLWRQVERKLRKRALYLHKGHLYAVGEGPAWREKVVFRKTPHFLWRIYYKPVDEVEWTFEFTEKVYLKIQQFTGLVPGIERFVCELKRRRLVFGYTFTPFGEIQFFAKNWIPLGEMRSLLVHLIFHQFLFTSLSQPFPEDWWDFQYGPFHALLTVKVLKDLGFSDEAKGEHEKFIVFPLYRLFQKWTEEKGDALWKRFFTFLKKDGIDFYTMAQRYPLKRRSLYLVGYLSLALGRNVAEDVEKAGLGRKPAFWRRRYPKRRFSPYRISKEEVEAFLNYRKWLLEKGLTSQWKAFQKGYVKGVP